MVAGLHYRRDAFAEGLSSLGFDLRLRTNHSPGAGDVLVLWNRYARDEQRARQYEAVGGVILVAENAWLGPEDKDRHLFALCRGHHNGAGSWHVGSENRLSSLSIELKPWREHGDYILILPQRGMGEAGVAMPRDWPLRISDRLGAHTKREIRWHYHPGPRPHPPIDFTGCWAAVTWGSGAAIKAIVAGIPVFHELPQWIGAGAARCGIEDIEHPFLGDRMPMLHRLSWAQWSADEIERGEPFKWLLPSR